MSKYLLKINDKKMIYPDLDLGYILGIQDFCWCFDKTFSITELKNILKKTDNVFACLNRVIYEDELEDYKNLLLELDELNLKGIIIGDLAALTYNLKTPLILDQMHLNNSYLSINHYYNNDNCGCYLTNDITLEEINEIRKNTNATLLKDVFGYLHLSTSARKLVSNYLSHFKIKDKSDINYIKENNSNDEYIIKEDDFGTHILSGKVLDLFEEKDEIDVDYLVINSYLLEENVVKNIIEAYVNNDKSKIESVRKVIKTQKGFINRKTIYKVKHYE